MLEEYLGNPEIAVHALVYFQLRAVGVRPRDGSGGSPDS